MFYRTVQVARQRLDAAVCCGEAVVPDEDTKQAAHRALVDRVLNAAGRTSAEQRAQAFGNADMPPPLGTLVSKVATAPTQVTDADFAAAKAAGFTEDQLFEQVIAAAVGSRPGCTKRDWRH